MDHSASSSFIAVTLSHGDENSFQTADGEMKWGTLLHFVNSANCPTLSGKPKVGFIFLF